MNAAIRAIRDKGPPFTCEGNCVWLPGIGQLCRGRRLPGSTPDEARQGKHAQTVIVSITDEEVAIEDNYTMGIR